MEPVQVQVLVVDDDPAVGLVVGKLLAQVGIGSLHVLGGDAALTELRRAFFDLVITDLLMPEMDGLELLRRVREAYPETPVILITAHGTVPVAVEAMKAGAADFVTKPFDRDALLYTVQKAVAAARALAPGSAGTSLGGERLVGVAPAMREAQALLRKAAPGNATVLLRGESGVGKDVAAHMVHTLSSRRSGPFIKVSCAAFPENLLESELFGSRKGAYTGAVDKPGRVELAAGGTLFLDEIGDLTVGMQVKLLRLLQDRVFERLGDTETQRADVRFVAATHRDLEGRMKTGDFREDLFYRLNVIPVWLPPLRERTEEIEALATEFCQRFGAEHGRKTLRFAPDALALLRRQTWPGNVRQLQNFVERLTILNDGPVITAATVEHELQRQPPLTAHPAERPATAAAEPREAFAALDAQRSEVERSSIQEALARVRGNRTDAAKLLGISRRTLYYKLDKYGLLEKLREEATDGR